MLPVTPTSLSAGRITAVCTAVAHAVQQLTKPIQEDKEFSVQREARTNYILASPFFSS